MGQFCVRNSICVDDDGASFHLKPLNLKHKGSLKCAQVLISLGLSMKISKQQTSSQVYMNRDSQYCAFAHLKLKACTHRYTFLIGILPTS